MWMYLSSFMEFKKKCYGCKVTALHYDHQICARDCESLLKLKIHENHRSLDIVVGPSGFRTCSVIRESGSFSYLAVKMKYTSFKRGN